MLRGLCCSANSVSVVENNSQMQPQPAQNLIQPQPHRPTIMHIPSGSNDYTVEWIGTGAGLNSELGNTSFALYSSEAPDKLLLVDCGYTVPSALLATGRLRNVVGVVITHAHSDHIGGLEALAQMSFFAYNKTSAEQMPALYVASESFAKDLWDHSLSGGMSRYIDNEGVPRVATLSTYYRVVVGQHVLAPGFPPITLFEQPHVPGQLNHGLVIHGPPLIYYSGDTTALPVTEAAIYFHDCHFHKTDPSDVHVSYTALTALPEEIKKRIWLVHLSAGWKAVNTATDGIAGLIMPGSKFYF